MNTEEKVIRDALASIGEHWDDVLILVSKPSDPEEGESRTTDFTANYTGSVFAVTRMAQEYVIRQDEITKELTRQRHEK